MTTVHTLSGKALIVGGKVSTNADCCCGCRCRTDEWVALAAGSVATCHGLVRKYLIEGYSSTFFASCTDCYAYGDPEWDGVFWAVNNYAFECTWHVCGELVDPCTPVSINTRRSNDMQTLLYWDTDTWRLLIQCIGSGSPFDKVIWDGAKATGATPVGVYTRTAGFDIGLSAVTIEEAP